MMFQFTDDCLTGIQSIDEEHRGLFDVINQAAARLKQPEESVEEVKALILNLKQYAVSHFTNEEIYMEQTRDPELPRQKKEHEAFRERLEDLKLDFAEEQEGRKTLEDLLEFLSRWLYHHILGSDILIGKMKVKEADPFAFTERFRTGIELVDTEHQKLFELIRDVDEVIHAELLHDKYDEIIRLLNGLKEYTMIHFHDEEAYMESIGYEELKSQKAAHQAFVDKIGAIDLDDVDNHQDEYLNELIQFLLGWLVNHILLMDKKIPNGK